MITAFFTYVTVSLFVVVAVSVATSVANLRPFA
jgi:hypothetical protein